LRGIKAQSDAKKTGYGGAWRERTDKHLKGKASSESVQRVFNAPVLRNAAIWDFRQTAEVELNARGWFYSTG